MDDSVKKIKSTRGLFVTRTSTKMPPVGELVIVAGGPAVWSGNVWISHAHQDRRIISWEVLWWMPFPLDEDVLCYISEVE